MKKINIKKRKLLGLWFCCFFVFTFLAARESNNSQALVQTNLVGTVSDDQGNLFPGVMVELMNIRTGIKMINVSNENGEYRFQNIEVGEYWVTVEMQGFNTQKKKVTLGIMQSMKLNFVLPVGDPIYGTVEGIVRLKPSNAAGNPLITLADENGEIIEEQEGRVTKMGCFAYSFSTLSPGTYKISVMMAGFSQKTRTIRLAEQQVKKHNFTLTQKKKKP